ncbi:hypothetical protein EJ08DRAFT_405478 [Tothia fuscella]|uniref:Uncharacterized protein n=1 Tax=Tothia fuscella TaxID=1048955 RepID=A0A9P4NKH8_9PEZI|nr:hypothetical protein EJ08DRAFT_405478 [Tothia fuscella]
MHYAVRQRLLSAKSTKANRLLPKNILRRVCKNGNVVCLTFHGIQRAAVPISHDKVWS